MVGPKVISCIARLLGFCDADKNGITLDAELEGKLGMDSLDALELTIMLEEEFEIEMSDAEVELCKTVADMVALVERKAGVAA